MPDGLLCSICEDLFQDPTTTVDGHSYCRDCISCWFRQHDKRAAERQRTGHHLDAHGQEVIIYDNILNYAMIYHTTLRCIVLYYDIIHSAIIYYTIRCPSHCWRPSRTCCCPPAPCGPTWRCGRQWKRTARIGREDDMVGNPHGTQIYQLELLELILLSKLDKRFLCRAVRADSISVNSTLRPS